MKSPTFNVGKHAKMKFEKELKLKELSDFLGRDFYGDEKHIVSGINEIHKVEHGDVVFVDHPKYFNARL